MFDSVLAMFVTVGVVVMLAAWVPLLHGVEWVVRRAVRRRGRRRSEAEATSEEAREVA